MPAMTAAASRLILAGALAVALGAAGSTPLDAQAPPPAVKARAARVAALPKMDGANLKVHAVEVTYPPGATSTAHRHPCPVVGYMISGTMRMQVSDGPLTEYKPGETFVEMPTDVHRVATNPSADTPAVFLVTFVCDKETPLTVPEPAAK
jgi:quercetin dioxygenase-like cupin family protein